MHSFFDSNAVGNFEALAAYVRSHSPEQMVTDVRASSVDPNTLIEMADLLRMTLQDEARGHAQALYSVGIGQLQSAPHRVASGTDLTAARCMLISCCLPDAADEAFSVIESDPRIVLVEPALAAWVAMALFQNGQLEKVRSILSDLEKIPSAALAAQLQENGIGLDVMEVMRSEVRRLVGRI